MTPENVREALQAARIWGNRFQIHLTGGEPFLRFPLLLEAAETARELSIPVYVETNAGWCVNERTVEERFRALRDVGLRAVLISCSPFHAETIPPERMLLAAREAAEVFGPSGVILYLPGWLDLVRSFGERHTTPLDQYVHRYGKDEAGRLFWEGYGLISGGRSGYRIGHLARRSPPQAYRHEDCRRDILFAHHSHLDLYGNFISGFCGGLAIGDWHGLATVVQEAEAGHYPSLIARLIEAGPVGLLEFAERGYGFVPSPEGYAGKCHLCVDVRRFLIRFEAFPELRPREFYERF